MKKTKHLKGIDIFEGMTHVSNRFIEEAAEMPLFGDTYPIQRVERHPTWRAISRLMNTAPAVAILCAVISISVVVAMVMWGRNGTNAPPAGQPVESQTETERGTVTETESESEAVTDEELEGEADE